MAQDLERKSKDFEQLHSNIWNLEKQLPSQLRQNKREVATIPDKQKKKNLSKRNLASSSVEPNRNKSGLVSWVDKNLNQ